jgi:hypothetical protein
MAAIDPETIATARAKLQAMLKEGGDRSQSKSTIVNKPQSDRRTIQIPKKQKKQIEID